MGFDNVNVINVKNNVKSLFEQLEELDKDGIVHTIDFTRYYSTVANGRLNSVSRSLLDLMLEGEIDYSKFKFYMDMVERVRNRFFSIISIEEDLGLKSNQPSINRLLSTLENLNNVIATDFTETHPAQRAHV